MLDFYHCPDILFTSLMDPINMYEDFFIPDGTDIAHKKYEALKLYYCNKTSPKEVAEKFGYTLNSFHSLVRDFNKQLKENGKEKTLRQFFTINKPGRRPSDNNNKLKQRVIELRKQYLSVPDIKAIMDSESFKTSETNIFNILKKEGFARLPRRSGTNKKHALSTVKIEAAKSKLLEVKDLTGSLNSDNIGILSFIPYIVEYGIDKIITSSSYPGTKAIPVLNAILCFIALKLSNFARYTKDDMWCMDRGAGLFAGLNILPKAAWFSSYSHRVTREMNLDFLRRMAKLWQSKGLLSDTINADFVAVPYFGDDADHLENNWSGSRNKSLTSILAAIMHDPETGIMTYGDTTVRHDDQSDCIIEFLDFYKENGNSDIKYLVFDSKFTTYQNLNKLDKNGVKFITIRQRGGKIMDTLQKLSKNEWKSIRIKTPGGRTRQIKIFVSDVNLSGVDNQIRQIAISGNGKIKPALIITNDYNLSVHEIVVKYARRWLVEKNISEQTHFFHLNKVSSSMVIKVDFDLTMTILAHNLYRIMAGDIEGFENATADKLFNKIIQNSGNIVFEENNINIKFKKKRNMPALITALEMFQKSNVPWIHNFNANFEVASIS